MKRLHGSLLAVLFVGGVAIAGCGQAAPAPPPTSAPAAAAAPAAPVAAPAAPAKPAEPTKPAPEAAKPAAAPQPTAAAAAAKQPDYPVKGKTITLIAGWGAGGTVDAVCRLVAAELETVLGTPVQVVNKVGAGSQVAWTDLVKSKPDGYTLMLTSGVTTVLLYLAQDRQASFGRKDFQLISQIGVDPLVLSVSGDSKFKTMADLDAAAKAKPEQVKIATMGLLSLTHLVLLSLEDQISSKLALVHMNSGAEAATAMLGGHIDGAVGASSNWASQVKGGQIRYLGVMDKQESKAFPGVKTMESQGHKLYGQSAFGMAAPAGTPKEIVSLLSGAIKKVTQSDSFGQKFAQFGAEPRYVDTPEFEKLWTDTETEWAPVLKKALEQEKK